MTQTKCLFWDFDGTLATRPGMWGGCLIDLLDRELPGHGLTRDHLIPYLNDGFPWHDHGSLHTHLNEPSAWWEHLNSILARALARAGLPEPKASAMVVGVRDLYLAPSGWHLFSDSVEALSAAAKAGWCNVIVSNHVPELAALVSALGLNEYVQSVVTSASVGAEKPHPMLFRAALEVAGHPDVVWMIGDNPVADIAGAARLGMAGVLVRMPEFTTEYVDEVNRKWGGPNWLDWQDDCRYRADNALAAVEAVEREVSARRK